MSTLAALAKRYSEIPEMVLLKADLLFGGIQVNDALIQAGVGAMPHFRQVEWQGERRALPYFLLLPDGTGEELLSLVRPDPDGRYHLTVGSDGRFTLHEGEEAITELRPQLQPAWRRWAAENGRQRMLMALNAHGDMLVANVAPACEYWPEHGGGETFQCRFCGYGAVSERSRGLGQQREVPELPEEVLKEFREVLAQAAPEVRHLFLVGGSMRNRDQEGQRYLQLTAAAVAAAPRYRGIIGCGSQALKRDWITKIAAAGAGYACHNLEVWDADLWPKLCPGKAHFIGRDEWLQNMLDAVAVFGRGGVVTTLVVGAELVPPAGFKTKEEAIASDLEGTDWLLAHGVVPIYSPFSPSLSSIYDRASAPDIHYFLQLNLEAARLRRRHQLPLNTKFVCHRCTYAQLEGDLDRLR